MASRGRRTTSRQESSGLEFNKKLVLNQYMLRLFGVKTFSDLTKGMERTELEGLDENGYSKFYRHLAESWKDTWLVSDEILRAYDANIVRHTKAIQGKRDRPIVWKYFQYLMLLFTEIYLDGYFCQPEALVKSLNEYLNEYNADKCGADRVPEYSQGDLNKIAFQSATGSGKTLIMHVNILQYRHYLEKYRRIRELNRVILLTPNEGLSKQHFDELKLSGIKAEIFNKDGTGRYIRDCIDIIDINKLREDSGEKTIAASFFEGNNLVLVDEGHRGSSGEEWMKHRNTLCEKGFSFEYSATFEQAVKASGKQSLINDYLKCILFDYSYRFFYNDGYGKDYRILNIKEDRESSRKTYMTACLMTYYQQLRYYLDNDHLVKDLLIEKPLMVFVGGSVTKTTSKSDRSDTQEIVLFLADFVRSSKEYIAIIDSILRGLSGLGEDGVDLFKEKMTYLKLKGWTPEEVYHDMLQQVFNGNAPGSLLHVENLKGAGGEIALRIGDREPFGVIYIGDDAGFIKLLEEDRDNGLLELTPREFGTSLFEMINKVGSGVNVLIGSRKFTEGWNSWRVSTMGLMNFGKSEGAQAIQLFGRGVRLKGLGFSLKRSSRLDDEYRMMLDLPKYHSYIETLNIFGIHADYMKQFRKLLEEAGMPVDYTEFILPVKHNAIPKGLKTIAIKGGGDFQKDEPYVGMGITDKADLKRYKVVLDWYPKIEIMQTARQGKQTENYNRTHFKDHNRAFLDVDAIYMEILRHKSERNLSSLEITKEDILILLKRNDWYELYIPEKELEFTSYDKVAMWQEMAVILLTKYVEHYYYYRKALYEKRNLAYAELKEDDPNLIENYVVHVSDTENDLLIVLDEMRKLIKSDNLDAIKKSGDIDPVCFSRHLYEPLLFLKKGSSKCIPTSLNDGEYKFVQDLRDFYKQNPRFFEDKQLFLLRNQTRGKGIGFFEANNFHPDFIIWLVTKDRQFITFVDPKGLLYLEGLEDPKIRFAATIKENEKHLGDPSVVLNSFIISVTKFKEIGFWTDGDIRPFNEKHVLFPDKDENYICTLLEMVLG